MQPSRLPSGRVLDWYAANDAKSSYRMPTRRSGRTPDGISSGRWPPRAGHSAGRLRRSQAQDPGSPWPLCRPGCPADGGRACTCGGDIPMRHRIAALTGAGVMIAALGAVALAATRQPACRRPGGAGRCAGINDLRYLALAGEDQLGCHPLPGIPDDAVHECQLPVQPHAAQFLRSYAQNHRIRWPEFRTWQINDTALVAIKLEDDGDLHLRLRSSTGKTMIAEIPRRAASAPPRCGRPALRRPGITSRAGTGSALIAGTTCTRRLTSRASASSMRSTA